METKGNNMSVQTITINGIDLDVYYSHESEKDPFGTGDSPTLHYVDIQAVELASEPTDISSILAESVLDDIEQQIIDIESN